jgi:hypothetical protein
MTITEKIENILGEDENVLLADGFEDAFIGIGRQFGKPIAIYDRSKCIDILKEDMSEEEAEEYFQFNTEGAWAGEQTPIFLEKFID